MIPEKLLIHFLFIPSQVDNALLLLHERTYVQHPSDLEKNIKVYKSSISPDRNPTHTFTLVLKIQKR